jgi:hypothetical protein
MPENGAATSGGNRRRFPNFFARYENFSASGTPNITPSTVRSPASSSVDTQTLVNPFSRRDEFSSQHILIYKIATAVTYLLLLVTTFYYTFNAPHERNGEPDHHGKHNNHHQSTIWGQNGLHPTSYSQNAIITSIYV